MSIRTILGVVIGVIVLHDARYSRDHPPRAECATERRVRGLEIDARPEL